VRRASPRLWIIGALILALAARSFWRGGAWTALLGLAGVFSLAVALRTRRSYVPELVASGLASALGAFGQLVAYLAGAFRLVTAGRVRGVRWATVLVPILVVGLFGLVFMAANPLIERWAGLAWDALTSGGGHLLSPVRVGFWLVAALIGAGMLSPRVRELRLSERLGPGHRIEGALDVPAETSLATARNVLLGVNVLFLAYNALDAVYLWAGTPPPGIDHTGYAHRGTVWLTVSLLMSTLVLGIIFRGGMNARARETRPVRVLGLAWAAQNFVLAAGTFRRIAMYVDDSGLTVLRCLGIGGVVAVAVAFSLIVAKVARRHTTLWLLRSQFDAFLVALVVWTVLPVDTIVWSFNVAQIEAGRDQPLLHLYEQSISAEAIPALTRLVHHRDPVIAAGVAERLQALQSGLALEAQRSPRWTQAEIARSRALLALEDAAPRMRRLLAGTQPPSAAFDALRNRAFQSNGLDSSYDTSWRF
jgi:hypothetical protein